MKNGELKIESGIPIPTKKYGKGKYKILKELEVGQSVFLPAVSYRSAWQSARNNIGPGKYVVRKEDGGCRIWRTD